MASNTQVIPVSLRGGLNLAAGTLEIDPGECAQLLNYEVNTLGRYQRCLGYERYDGRLAPSEVMSYMLPGYPFDNDEEELAAVEAERAIRRAAITVVPGSGRILGIFVFKGFVYAFRNNAAGTEAKLWVSSSTGWLAVTTPTLLPNGHYKTILTNFTGSAGSIEIVGVDGVNPAFRYNGTAFTQITGPITPDKPTHVQALPSQVLLLAYRGGSLVFSGVGEPEEFSPVDGGGEIALADEITGMELQPDNSMAIWCRNRTYVLYGTSSADFNLTTLTTNTGAIQGSVQSIGDSIYLDDRGLTRLNRVQQFGNFDSATISQKVEPLLKRYTTRVTTSFVIKSKNQYRLCFDDGTGLIVTFFGVEVSGFSTFDYNRIVRCACSAEDAQGRDVVYFGSDDGYVYQAEKGFSYDGAEYTDVLRPAFNHLGQPEQIKRWRKVVLECESLGKTDITVIPEFDYSSPDVPADRVQYLSVIGGGGYWDQATWDQTTWTAASVYTADIYMDGVARNMSLVITSTSNISPPHITNSLLVHVSPRGRRR